ncbi:Sensory neuron membrane protein 2-like Protein [Tribolium castaneum]|uniref:Sensory neuron membrane protein 2 n=1 Tax=Tribolium castaneum TaxID=7070 RepID=A0A139WK32_TRICA|nr:Sensory neuron membrane protein 2-like Protein [Tribolium castaneum]
MFALQIGSKIILTALLISTVLLVLSTLLIIQVFPDAIRDEVYKNVKLVKGTEQYDRFVELPFPIIFKVYFFNVENVDDVQKGSKPILREKGPYVYKQYRRKTILDINEEEDTISYKQSERFEFDKEASGNFSEDDYVTMLNAPVISMLQMAEPFHQMTGALAHCLDDIFPNMSSNFMRVKVKDILFDGVRFCVRHLSICEVQRTLACSIAAEMKNVEKLSDDSLKFSLFGYKSKSDDGVYTVKRGIKDVHSLGQIIRLNNATYTDYWNGLGKNTSCDKVQGTDATLYPPGVGKDSVFQIYSTDICRYVEIKYSKEMQYKGIKGYLFTADNSTLRPKTPTAGKDCFCTNKTKGIDGKKSCFLDGVIDMQSCTGVDVLLSFPHFLWADEKYLKGVDGLTPNEDLHSTFLLVEPETGTPLQGLKRIQINAVLRPIPYADQTSSLPRAVFPLLWVEEGVSLTDEYIIKLKEMYFNKVAMVDIIKWTLLGTSTVLTILFASLYVHKYRSTNLK